MSLPRTRIKMSDADIVSRFERLGYKLAVDKIPVGRSKSPGYGHLKLPHSIIAVSAAEQR